MDIEVYTAFPCLIKIDDQEEILEKNEHLIVNSSSFNVYPLKEGYSFNVDIYKESNFYKVVTDKNKTMVFLLGGLLVENVCCKDFNYEGIKSRIEVGKKQVVFISGENKKVLHLQNEILQSSLGNFLFIDYCLIKYKDSQSIICYNAKKNATLQFSGDEIEIDKTGFVVKKSAFNYKEIEAHYVVDKEGLKVKNKNFILSDFSSSAPQTTAFKFMNGIVEGDYEGCIKLLSSSLAEKLTADKLRGYFGHVSYFYMLDSTSCFAISDNKNIIYEFTVSGSKISDITDNL